MRPYFAPMALQDMSRTAPTSYKLKRENALRREACRALLFIVVFDNPFYLDRIRRLTNKSRIEPQINPKWAGSGTALIEILSSPN